MNPLPRASLLILLWSLAGCGGGGGDGAAPPVTPAEPGYRNTTVYSSRPDASLASAVEGASITPHRIVLNGRTIAYTATAGHLNATDADTGTTQASMFYIAYTADGEPAATRPLVFFYNGGPGSASLWLHLGSFGPKRVVTHVPQTTLPNPFQLVDNADSLLDTADLVFVDAVGTGYSQAIAPATNQSFWGVDADASVMRNFITRYLAANGRAASPAFLYGESYGTTRGAVLANLMVTAGMRLDGVILHSAILDYNVNCAVLFPVVVSCEGFVPSYGLTGAWFGLLDPPPADPDSFAARMRDFSAVTYAPAVEQFLVTRTPPDASLSDRMADLTGALASRWQADFNLDPDTYRRTLLPGQLAGRYDARVVAADGSALAAEGDPSSTLITAPFIAAQRANLADDLKYSAVSNYTTLSNAITTWDFAHDGRPLPDVVPDLATALAQRPALRVLAVSGYHDLATPFFQTELDLARLGSMPGVQTLAYPGGHMTYLDDASRPRIRADVAAFVRSAAGASP